MTQNPDKASARVILLGKTTQTIIVYSEVAEDDGYCQKMEINLAATYTEVRAFKV